ncbi:hypothetical protein BYT27DRAFT_7081330 [Phlegmacium glaucopus]|nr:hypothetical protein BYT27DRAFT_7081330 [Phlegmacium glaucopus]
MTPKLMGMVAPVLAFRTIPTTLLTLITYLSVFIALIVTDTLPNAPQNQAGLNIKEAYQDLRQITAHPHPYNSHSNDAVRSYLLSRLIPQGEQYPHVHISNDITTNGSWSLASSGVYFEGTNILVKIDGTSTATSGGVLFSAHYDSVSTAPGSTDDGMGVVTLLQLVQYFAKNRPLRTAVFNINNGEEDWLNGAHAFLEHPWSDLTDTFLNLEGAAEGGRPILFRASSTNPVRAFRSKHVPHPHANVLSSDAFARGFIRSGTDYSVYAGPRSSDPGANSTLLRSGMQGLDFAFYKGRSRYHTKYDTVPYTLGGERSLWSMMEVAKGVGIELLSSEEDQGEVRDKDAPVYFDLFKSIVFVFPIINLLAFNIVVLILGPTILVLLVVRKHFINKRQYENGNLLRSRPSLFRYFGRDSLSSNSLNQDHDDVPPVYPHRLIAVWTHSKFWIALVVTLGLQALLIFLYTVINPFAVYSSPYIVLFSFLSLTYLSLNFVLTSLPLYFAKSISLASAQEDKHVTFLHLYLFTWVLLVLSTVGITSLKPGLGGGYLISAWNISVGLACMIAGVAGVVAEEHDHAQRNGHVAEDETYEELEGANSNEGEHQLRVEPEADESTPLIQHSSQITSNPQRRSRKVEGEAENFTETWWWILQFIISVPLPVILVSQVVILMLDAMPQTLADGSPILGVYGLTTLLSLLLVLPLSPFTSKLQRNRALSFLVLSLFILSILHTWTTFPFSNQAPLKVFFSQHVEIDLGLDVLRTSHGVNHTHVSPKMITTLAGHPRYLPNSAIISNLPSAQNPVHCKPDPKKSGLVACEWNSGPGMLPVPGSWSDEDNKTTTTTTEYFDASVSRTGPSSARIKVKGVNTRSCRVYFDNQPIYEYTVHHHHPSGDGDFGEEERTREGVMQFGYEIGEGGINNLRLWSRTWDREFVVDVNWERPGDVDGGTIQSGLQGRIACEWSEYESGLVDHGSGRLGGGKVTSGKIPAFEEVLRFLPEWAVTTTLADGLAEVFAPFSI